MRPTPVREPVDPFKSLLDREAGRPAAATSKVRNYYLAQPVSLIPGKTHLTLVLRPAAKLSGSVEWDAAKPPGVTVRCTQGNGMTHEIVDWRPKRRRKVGAQFLPEHPELQEWSRKQGPTGNRFEFLGLRPGFATVEIYLGDERLFHAKDVPVGVGDSQPAVLQSIELSVGTKD